MIEITKQTVLDLLPEAIATRGGDHVSPTFLPTGIKTGAGALSATEDPNRGFNSMCRYVAPDGKSPQCIVGTILHLAGLPLETLSNHEGRGSWDVVERLNNGDVADIDEGASYLLNHLQAEQDNGKAWGTLAQD